MINEGIQMNKTVNEISEIEGFKEYKEPLRHNFVFVYAIFFPFIFAMNWFIQFYVYLFYRSLHVETHKESSSEGSEGLIDSSNV